MSVRTQAPRTTLLAHLTAHRPVPPLPAGEDFAPAPSPDGRRVAYLSDRAGTPAVWVRDVDAAEAVALPSGDEPVLAVSWSPDGQWLACVVAPGGAPRTELWVLRPDGTQRRQVAGFGRRSAALSGWLPGGALMAVTETAERGTAVLVDADTGHRRVLAEGDLLTLLDVSPDGGSALLRRGPRNARWLELLDVATGDRVRLLPDTGRGSTDQGWFGPDGTSVLARTDAFSELAALVRVDLTRPASMPTPTRLAGRPDAELEHVAPSVDRRRVALLWNTYGGRSELSLLDLASGVQRAVTAPGEVLDGAVFAADADLLCLTAQGPVQPREVWLVDPATGTPRPLRPDTGAARTGDSGVAPQLVDLRARDGLPLSGWLYRPPGPGPWPTAISLHGGPEAQERPGYNPLFQALVAQGVAVFAPNVRGSSGFGRTFVAADNLAGRYGAIADVAACADHLVDTGVAIPGRLGCLGRSYGGYLVLAVLVNFPGLFAAGVAECGISDFRTFYANTEPWIAAAAVSKYGDPVRDADLLRDLSPMTRIDQLDVPVLLIHGANDTNVPAGESAQVAQALAARDVPHGHLVLTGEGHDFLARDNAETARTATTAWLSRHLAVTVAALG
ncbi:prolyl oligopeptidase family serine peptidase [Micromonospora lupini]|uniref:Putative Acylaminoacyl-peptidase n=1 Tax=Micromonospora lupini str. Lupac 08 TaxID=1150864 RepID=I0L626_9ACTN|nr:prolyl oligopeptidase family serine peptidase [Micromonospora lupini]CCH19273.1 Putative Acylaminoacyl-peptidase [Micromonospora lupini str. Lupac 08]